MNKDIIDFIKWLYKNELIIDENTDGDYINALYGEYRINKN